MANAHEYLTGMTRQMAWADATIWGRIVSSPTAAGDAKIAGTLHHVHLVQHLFRRAWAGEPLAVRAQAEFATPADLARWARDAHREIAAFLSEASTASLKSPFREPWTDQFEARWPHPAAPHTLAESVVQVALHTAHHRGQVCTRLREVGLEPPTIDFIVWLWGGRPSADWSFLDRS